MMYDTSNLDTLLACIQKTLLEVQIFIEDSQIINLQRDLEEAKESDIDQQRMIVVRTLDLMMQNQETETRFLHNLKTSGVDIRHLRDPILRKAFSEYHGFAPYQLFICPIDPTHYRKRLKPSTMEKKCPLHRVELVVDD